MHLPIDFYKAACQVNRGSGTATRHRMIVRNYLKSDELFPAIIKNMDADTKEDINNLGKKLKWKVIKVWADIRADIQSGDLKGFVSTKTANAQMTKFSRQIQVLVKKHQQVCKDIGSERGASDPVRIKLEMRDAAMVDA